MNRSHPSRIAAAFSLIEILISVLILALGLLGLGALFPVVLREQRIGTDHIQGVMATNNTRALLAQMDLNALLPTSGPPGRDVWNDWRWRSPGNQSELDSSSGATKYHLGGWKVAPVDSDGEATFGDGDAPASSVLIPLAARLHPSAGADQGKPQYVWDIAVHRLPDFVSGNSSRVDPLQAVIFVRKVDPRVRVNPGRTLGQVLLGVGIPTAERRLPVGRQNGNTFLPSLDGTDGSGGLRYSEPVIANRGTDFQIDADEGRYISNIDTGQNDGIGALMAQPNQKLVDNLGNIYTVETVEQDPTSATRKRIRISPPMGLSLTVPEDDDLPHIHQFIFTAQIPAGVAVMEVLP